MDLPFPRLCPSCQHPVTVALPHLVCSNISCDAKLVFLLEHAAMISNFDITGLGEEVARALVSAGLVKNLYDLFMLEEGALASMPFGKGVYGTVRAKKLLDSIDKACDKPWNVVLHSLGCPGLGKPECELIASKYSLWDLAVAMSPGQLKMELMSLKGIGEKTAVTFAEWLRANLSWLAQIDFDSKTKSHIVTSGLILILNTTPEKPDTKLQPLLGYSIVLTGTFSSKSARGSYEKRLKALGCEIPGSVSSKTTYLVAGENVGASKMSAAYKHGVQVIDEAALIALLEKYEKVA